MRQESREFEILDVAIVIVTFQGGPMADAYVADSDTSWPVAIDETRQLYRAYGMERGRRWDVWGPASIASYLRLLLRGRRLQKSAGDVLQLGGDVLIDPDGIVRLHHVGIGPADRPSVQSILDRIRGSDRI